MTLHRYFKGFIYTANGTESDSVRSMYIRDSPMLCLDELKELGGHDIVHYVEDGESYVETVDPMAFEVNRKAYGRRY